MRESCHTCGGELPPGSGESPFCPHCGTPQLFLSLDYQSPETGGEPKLEKPGPASTGIVPPPRPQQVDWKMAIRCAAAVAGVAGLLSLVAMRVPVLTGASLLWIFSGSLITLGLYQRRRPTAWMDAGVGARIGVVVGLCQAMGLAIPLAVAGVIARFGLHSMTSFDAQLAAIFEQVIQKSQQSTTPFPPEAMQLIHSQEFRAWYVLFVFALMSAFLLVLSMAGGAFAGLLRMRRKAAV
jgi:hypothetical protein